MLGSEGSLLQMIQRYFYNLGVELGQECKGHIWVNETKAMFRISSISVLNNVIISHFDKYPLITEKQADFKEAI